MTESDKRQEKAMLLLEHQEAESDLAIMREKGKRLAGRIQEIQHWLISASTFGNPYYAQNEWRNLNSKVRSDPAFKDALNWDAMVGFVDQLLSAVNKAEELASRKKDLGLK